MAAMKNRLAAGYSLEHTGYFDGTRFGEVAQAEGRRMDLAEDMRRTAFQFGSFKEPVSPKRGKAVKKWKSILELVSHHLSMMKQQEHIKKA